jgi:hypothetical protein
MDTPLWQELFCLLENGIDRHNAVCDRDPSRTARISEMREQAAEISSTTGKKRVCVACLPLILKVSSEGLLKPFKLTLGFGIDFCGNVGWYRGSTPITSLTASKLILYPLFAEL